MKEPRSIWSGANEDTGYPDDEGADWLNKYDDEPDCPCRAKPLAAMRLQRWSCHSLLGVTNGALPVNGTYDCQPRERRRRMPEPRHILTARY